MKKVLILSLLFPFLPLPSASAQLLRNIFGGRRQQRQQIQTVQCYQPITYQYQQQYAVVAAVPLTTIPLAVDLQAYQYQVNSTAFQSFREYMLSKNQQVNQPNEQVAQVAPQKIEPAESDDPRVAGAQVLKKNCISCHQQGNKPKSDFSIFDKSGNMFTSLPWNTMMERITSDDPQTRMPLGKTLRTNDVMSIFRLASSGLVQNRDVQTADNADIMRTETKKPINPFD